MDTTTKRCWTLKGIGKGIIVLAVMLAWFGASAQDVTVTVNKNRQNLPASLTELIDNPGQYVGVTLQNNLDVTTRVYLKMSLTSDYVTNGAPLSLTTQEKGNVRPFISLRPHETRRFTSISDFTEHFSGRLTTTATTDMLTMTRIPEGNYSLCFEVYRWQQQVLDDGEPMSNDCAEYIVCYTLWRRTPTSAPTARAPRPAA